MNANLIVVTGCFGAPVKEKSLELARQRGLRGRFRLAVCGARLELGGLPVDCPEYKTAAVAGWMVRAWKG